MWATRCASSAAIRTITRPSGSASAVPTVRCASPSTITEQSAHSRPPSRCSQIESFSRCTTLDKNGWVQSGMSLIRLSPFSQLITFIAQPRPLPALCEPTARRSGPTFVLVMS
jgi:hypothetical protein